MVGFIRIMDNQLEVEDTWKLKTRGSWRHIEVEDT
jgi:hypothetical protein